MPGKISVDQILITTMTLDIYTPNIGIGKPNVDSKPYLTIVHYSSFQRESSKVFSIDNKQAEGCTSCDL